MGQENELVRLLKERAKPDTVDEEVLANLAAALARRINDLENSLRNGDVTIKKYETELHKNNLKEVDKVFEHAHALLQSRYGERMKPQLNELLLEMTALKAYMQVTRSTSKGKLPKSARLYFCVDIMVAWKLIKSTDEIPRRSLDSIREPQGEFFYFIKALLVVAGGHVAHVNADELHKDILEAAKELDRLREQADNPEIIDLNQLPASLWGK